MPSKGVLRARAAADRIVAHSTQLVATMQQRKAEMSLFDSNDELSNRIKGGKGKKGVQGKRKN